MAFVKNIIVWKYVDKIKMYRQFLIRRKNYIVLIFYCNIFFFRCYFRDIWRKLYNTVVLYSFFCVFLRSFLSINVSQHIYVPSLTLLFRQNIHRYHSCLEITVRTHIQYRDVHVFINEFTWCCIYVYILT